MQYASIQPMWPPQSFTLAIFYLYMFYLIFQNLTLQKTLENHISYDLDKFTSPSSVSVAQKSTHHREAPRRDEPGAIIINYNHYVHYNYYVKLSLQLLCWLVLSYPEALRRRPPCGPSSSSPRVGPAGPRAPILQT